VSDASEAPLVCGPIYPSLLLLLLLLTRHHWGFELIFGLKTSLYSSFATHHLIYQYNMLSTRGEAYAKAGLADGYLGPRKTPFDKDTKQGVVSFSNAENVSQPQHLPY
jgi:hypothetical protein